MFIVVTDCPVCGAETEKSRLSTAYSGHKYLFCSQVCKEKFEDAPEKYADNE